LRIWRREFLGDTGRVVGVGTAGAAGAGLLLVGLHAQADAAGAGMVVVAEVFESLIFFIVLIYWLFLVNHLSSTQAICHLGCGMKKMQNRLILLGN
jgi:hypothetical protein